MLKNIKEKIQNVKKEKSSEGIDKPFIVYGVIFLICFLCLIGLGETQKGKKEYRESIISDISNKTYNNYSAIINVYDGEEESTLEYKTDSKINVYSSGLFPRTEYISYNNELYYIENELPVKSNIEDINNIFNYQYYDVNFILSLFNDCKTKFIDSKTIYCNIKLSKYFEHFNKKYDTDIKVVNDSIVIISIVFDKEVEKISVIYDDINRLLNKEDKELQYIINLNNINKNDFNDYLKYFNENNN